jgi:hypothetical protein
MTSSQVVRLVKPVIHFCAPSIHIGMSSCHASEAILKMTLLLVAYFLRLGFNICLGIPVIVWKNKQPLSF